MEETRGPIELPGWLLERDDLEPDKKHLYGFLLALRHQYCQPGRNGLIINLVAIGKELYPEKEYPEIQLRLGLLGLKDAGIIGARRMDYPPDRPECWEIDFYKEQPL